MSYRISQHRDSILDAAKIVSEVLRRRGEIEFSAIESLPVIRSTKDAEAVLGHVRSSLPVTVTRRVSDSWPILRWERIITLNPQFEQLKSAGEGIEPTRG